MPYVNPSNDRILATTLRSIQARLAALEHQQNGGVTDAQANVRLQWGLNTLDGTYCMIVNDAAGNPRARFGELPDGNHGIAIYSQANDGTYIELNDPQVSPVSGTLTTESTSFTTLAGSPTLPISVGASGKAFVSISALIGISVVGSGTATALMSLYVDGVAAPLEVASSVTLSASGGTLITGSNDDLLTDLAQGDHTLSLEYKSENGQSVSFTGAVITAIPY